MVTLKGTSGKNKLSGGSGKDNLSGMSGNDTLIGGAGNDVINGGSGNDLLNGGSGNDVYTFANGFGDDSLIDTGGVDTINLSAITVAVTVDIFSGAGDEIAAGTNSVNWAVPTIIEHVIGGKGADSLGGNNSANKISGGAGNDTITSGAGADTLDGGEGDDSLVGSGGDDKLIQSNGIDTMEGGTNNDTYVFTFLESSAGLVGDDINDSGGFDILDLSAIEGPMSVVMGSFAAPFNNGLYEIISSMVGIDKLITGSEGDFITGDTISEVFVSGAGDDTISGGGGNDVIIDGPGNDFYQGAAGDDMYDFLAPQQDGIDVISDANLTSDDLLRLRGVDTEDVVFSALDTDDDGFVDDLHIYNAEFNWTLIIENFFDDTNADDDASGAGSGAIENIAFEDDLINSFAVIASTYIPT